MRPNFKSFFRSQSQSVVAAAAVKLFISKKKNRTTCRAVKFLFIIKNYANFDFIMKKMGEILNYLKSKKIHSGDILSAPTVQDSSWAWSWIAGSIISVCLRMSRTQSECNPEQPGLTSLYVCACAGHKLSVILNSWIYHLCICLRLRRTRAERYPEQPGLTSLYVCTCTGLKLRVILNSWIYHLYICLRMRIAHDMS